MKARKVSLLIVLSILILTFCVSAGTCQDKDKSQPPLQDPQKILEGRIVYLKSYGGFVLITQAPHEEYKIINKNEKILGDLAKQRKIVKIEGRFPQGAYFLFIEKIDGKEYLGGK